MKSRQQLKRFSFVIPLAVITLLLTLPATATAISTSDPATVALDWNSAAVDTARAERVTTELAPGTSSRAFYQGEGLLYVSYVQAAVYDAAMKIDHRYRPYHHFSAAAGNASLPAAVIAAAYNTLVYYFPDQIGTLTAKYDASISALPNDKATARGINVGRAAAADLEALRTTDGRNEPTPVFGMGPLQAGLWSLPNTPGSTQIAQTPWMASLQPFMLDSTSQFRAPPPPALTSDQYAQDLNETELYGSKTSTVRTADQTNIGYFWNANVISQLNQTLRDFSTQHAMDLVDTTRLLAMGDMVSTDAGLACFDSKYTYQYWRPVEAIRHADIDGNAATTADPNWTPVLATPNHPEYPSQHGCFTSSWARVLANAGGTDNINLTIRGATPANTTGLVTTRTYATVDALLNQLVGARIYLGFHLRHSVIAGETLGTSVANWELQRYFLPTDNDN